MSYCKHKPGKFANIYTGTYNTEYIRVMVSDNCVTSNQPISK